MKDLREEVSFLKNKYEQLKSDVENQEQYTNNNTLGGTVFLFMVFPRNKWKVQIVLF